MNKGYELKGRNKLEQVAYSGVYEIHWMKDGMEWDGTKTAEELPAWLEWAEKYAAAYGFSKIGEAVK